MNDKAIIIATLLGLLGSALFIVVSTYKFLFLYEVILKLENRIKALEEKK